MELVRTLLSHIFAKSSELVKVAHCYTVFSLVSGVVRTYESYYDHHRIENPNRDENKNGMKNDFHSCVFSAAYIQLF